MDSAIWDLAKWESAIWDATNQIAQVHLIHFVDQFL